MNNFQQNVPYIFFSRRLKKIKRKDTKLEWNKKWGFSQDKRGPFSR